MKKLDSLALSVTILLTNLATYVCATGGVPRGPLLDNSSLAYGASLVVASLVLVFGLGFLTAAIKSSPRLHTTLIAMLCFGWASVAVNFGMVLFVLALTPALAIWTLSEHSLPSMIHSSRLVGATN